MYIVSSLIEADVIDLLWAADIHIHNAKKSAPVCLADITPMWDFCRDDMSLLEIRDPLMLSDLICIPVTEIAWGWKRLVGRTSMRRYDAGKMGRDDGWRRLAGRLVFRSISVILTADDWSKKHACGDFISLLMFAERLPSIEHDRARFLTPRKVYSSGANFCWERVGIV